MLKDSRKKFIELMCVEVSKGVIHVQIGDVLKIEQFEQYQEPTSMQVALDECGRN